eukprot:COSAG03_NODE_2791_length_2452_cov_1.198895_5_plen_47_part_00
MEGNNCVTRDLLHTYHTSCYKRERLCAAAFCDVADATVAVTVAWAP